MTRLQFFAMFFAVLTTGMSCEQRLITKEQIAMHTNLILLFKPALYSVL